MKKQIVNLPIKKWRAGNVEAAIWLNKHESEGIEVEFKTLSLSRSYKKRNEDTWRNEVINLRRGDIPKVLVVLQKAQEELLLSPSKGEE